MNKLMLTVLSQCQSVKSLLLVGLWPKTIKIEQSHKSPHQKDREIIFPPRGRKIRPFKISPMNVFGSREQKVVWKFCILHF